MSSNPIPAHYRRQNDITGNRNPRFVVSLAVYLDEVVDGPNGPQGSIALEIAPVDSFGHKRALDPNPSDVEIYAALHQAMTSLLSNPEVAEYTKKLAQKVKAEDTRKRLQSQGIITDSQIAKVQRQARIQEEIKDAQTRNLIHRLK